MKKLVIVLASLLLITGCNNLNNTPINKVEELLNKYQTLDESVINDLNKSLENTTYSESQKEKYKDIMKEQYKSLTYTIKDDEIDGDKAIITVSIVVKDYYKSLNEANEYFETHKEEFLDNNEYTTKFNDYKLDKLKDVKEKVTYTINFYLKKENNEWKVNQLSNEALDKINGVYAY